MRIALVNSFPNMPDTAEREFIARFHIACRKVGVDCTTVVTSDDIEACDPDAVLATHEFTRKLTARPTIGLIWSPLSFFEQDPYRIRSLLSYDGFLAGSAALRTFLGDFQRGLGVEKPISRDLFLPTSYGTDGDPVRPETPTLCYIGVHWDGQRHNELLDRLGARGLINFYGPEKSWRNHAESYRGAIPFDGVSVQKTIAEHGVALCLHRTEHRKQNTPSMRIFEALSVGATVICDDIPFARQHLADSAYFVDMEDDADRVAGRVEDILREVADHPDEAMERARRGKAWFDRTWSLEHKIKNTIVPLIEEVAAKGGFKASKPVPPRASPPRGFLERLLAPPEPAIKAAEPAVEVVIRTGGRALSFLERAMNAVAAANSAEVPLGLVIVDYNDRADVRACVEQRHDPTLPIRYVASPKTGYRSTALWDGLKAVRAPFVCHLDDDDTVFPNHYRQLQTTFTRFPHVNVAYTGVVKLEEEGVYAEAPNFNGPLNETIAETRELKFLDRFDLPRLARIDNYIQSNAWMARTAFLQELLDDDPEMVVTEDVYLYLLMAARGPFAFTGSPTAMWHWRSTSRENSMLNVEQAKWIEAGRRTMLRLRHVPFVSSYTFEQVTRAGSSEDELERRDAQTLPPLGLGQKIEGGLALSANLVLQRFHEKEMDGIWSSAAVAAFRINPADDLRKAGGFLKFEVMGAIDNQASKWIEIEIEGGESVRITFTDWSIHRLALPVSAGIVGDIHVIVRISELHVNKKDGADTRHLGVYLRAVSVSSTKDGDAQS